MFRKRCVRLRRLIRRIVSRDLLGARCPNPPQTPLPFEDQPTKMHAFSKSDFSTAVRLTESIYTHAVIHCVAELADGAWHNLYTSATYGRDIDLTSVPPHVDHKTYDAGHLLCLRMRTTHAEADRLVAEAKAGKTFFETWEINYAFVERLKDFAKPAVPRTSVTTHSGKHRVGHVNP
jgi:hypothetical protein